MGHNVVTDCKRKKKEGREEREEKEEKRRKEKWKAGQKTVADFTMRKRA